MSFYTRFYLQFHLKENCVLPKELEKFMGYTNLSNKPNIRDINFHSLKKTLQLYNEYFNLKRFDMIQSNFEVDVGGYVNDWLIIEPLNEQGINHEDGEIQGLIDLFTPYLEIDDSYNGWCGWMSLEGQPHKIPLFLGKRT